MIKLKPIVPYLKRAYKLDIIITRDTTGKHTTEKTPTREKGLQVN
jgi:hypothetical protein